ncbi:hypothetical protein HYH03_016832 [Edaphochlamys debaryana]|uniref:Phage tail collar domain-containing protein n=1 Tax=Edaphochlamys debaryana TaxID=47281 RepID=A0A835XKD1_9CHLO|nr:hypothetical protein HYH03_016832 [Edaphochlamys debaryana]|eukprot:KAG2484418.1 hypothetical protein HYH03_016832 [Edaphochlamys debaryana]
MNKAAAAAGDSLKVAAGSVAGGVHDAARALEHLPARASAAAVGVIHAFYTRLERFTALYVVLPATLLGIAAFIAARPELSWVLTSWALHLARTWWPLLLLGAAWTVAFWYLLAKLQRLDAALCQAMTLSLGASSLPVGAILPYASSRAAPNGFLLCDGQRYPRAQYATLARLVETHFASYDDCPPDMFHVPDLRGKVLVGCGTDEWRRLTKRVVGEFLGEEAHVLTAAELPPHTHGGTTEEIGGEHVHRTVVPPLPPMFAAQPGASKAGLVASSGFAVLDGLRSWVQHRHGFTTDHGAGLEGKPHNNMQPSLVVSFIIKAE